MEIKYLTKFISAARDKDKSWIIYIKDLKKWEKYTFRAKNLILAMGAGKTPIALRSLGLKHKFLESLRFILLQDYQFFSLIQ